MRPERHTTADAKTSDIEIALPGVGSFRAVTEVVVDPATRKIVSFKIYVPYRPPPIP